MLTFIDEYPRFPFGFPCSNIKFSCYIFLFVTTVCGIRLLRFR